MGGEEGSPFSGDPRSRSEGGARHRLFRSGGDMIGPLEKTSPSITQPGCSYTNRFTRGFARVLVGDKALYERGKYQYFEGNYEDAIQTFRKLVEEYPNSPSAGSALYWMGRQDSIREGWKKPCPISTRWRRVTPRMSITPMPLWLWLDSVSKRRL